MNIVVIGAGYVGICTSIGLAVNGHTVSVVDHDVSRIDIYRKGDAPFYEPNLDTYLKKFVGNGQLNFHTDYDHLEEIEAFFICTGTPPGAGGKADLSFVLSAIEAACKHSGNVSDIFVRSSCPPGSFDELKAKVSKHKGHKRISIHIYPEFLREGSALSDMKNPDRVVLGTEENPSNEVFESLFSEAKAKLIITTPWNAAMIKYGNNALLANLITFANAIATACEIAEGGDFDVVLRGLLSDRRWQNIEERRIPSISTYLTPGIGFGGSCLPKDVEALANSSQLPQLTKDFFKNISDTNTNRLKLSLKRITQKIKPGSRVLIAGISFKEGTDDLRNSPGMFLLENMDKEYEVFWLDSHVKSIPGNLKAKKVEFKEDVLKSHFFDAILVTTHDPAVLDTVSCVSTVSKTTVYLLRNQNVSFFESNISVQRVGKYEF